MNALTIIIKEKNTKRKRERGRQQKKEREKEKRNYYKIWQAFFFFTTPED